MKQPKYVPAGYKPVQEAPRAPSSGVRIVNEKPAPTPQYECNLKVLCTPDELIPLQVGTWSLARTVNEPAITKWTKTADTDGHALLTARCFVQEPKTLYHEQFQNAGQAEQYTLQPNGQSAGVNNAQFLPVKLAVQVDDYLCWVTKGYFYHFIDGHLNKEYRLMGDERWTFQITRSDAHQLSDELQSPHQLATLLLPYKVESSPAVPQHLLYRGTKLNADTLATIDTNWLDTHATRLDMDNIAAVRQHRCKKRAQPQSDQSVEAVITEYQVGSAYPFGDIWGQYSNRQAADNALHIMYASVPDNLPVINVAKIDAVHSNRILAGDERTIANARPPQMMKKDTLEATGSPVKPDALLKGNFGQQPVSCDLLNRQLNTLHASTRQDIQDGGQLVFTGLQFSHNHGTLGALKIVDTAAGEIPDNNTSQLAYWVAQGKFLDVPKHPNPHRDPQYIFTPSFSGCSFVVDEWDDNTLRVYHVEGGKENTQYNNLAEHGNGLLNYMSYRDYGYYQHGDSTIENITAFAFMKYNASARKWEIHYQRQEHAPAIQNYQIRPRVLRSEQHWAQVQAAPASRVVSTGITTIERVAN
ncbi:hypothetical protein [Vibrio sp. V39_P1S14PM300]|uniref:hypothetical protein n=1 Tax=Vibrio sp. V39_P1S14PM300 TaxID=1938690 RepID=UPI001372D678|nr:hypothetical protein [Vibrio sp. V39_P1S14PM300]NAX22444.1 hypothetical protein [Vibrio sp. V39_P1S14PM300]